jgi:molybdenum cofactor guanylyltransferase
VLDCSILGTLQEHFMTGVVLIGGKSRRFGSDKVLSIFRGKTLIEHVVDAIQPLFKDIFLVGHIRKGLEKFSVVEDIKPGYGPLGGIYTALKSIHDDRCFVFAADMPNLNRDFISYMVSQAAGHDIVMPVWSKGREPLHAIYSKTILPTIESLFAIDNYKIYALIEKTDTLFIPEEIIRAYDKPEVLFSNINTLEDRDRKMI